MRFWKRRGPSEEAKTAKKAAVRSKCLAEIDKHLARKAWESAMPDLEQVRENYKNALDGGFTKILAADK
jgi:hypothetical protein